VEHCTAHITEAHDLYFLQFSLNIAESVQPTSLSFLVSGAAGSVNIIAVRVRAG